MSSRYSFGTVRQYLSKYRSKTREKRASLMNFLRSQRQKIIQREREKLVKRIIFWGVFLGGGFLLYNEVYRKKVEIGKMNSKLQNFYASIMVKQSLKEEVTCITLSPKTLDELANIVSLAYKYHYKVMVRMEEVTKRQKIIICQKTNSKCIFLNLSALNTIRIDPTNSLLYAEAGAKCGQLNRKLEQSGFAPLFAEQLHQQTIYNAIVGNLPLRSGQLSKEVVSLELISSSGKNFRSAGQTNRYGQIPSLNPLFIGTGGVFALPTAANIRITPKQPCSLLEQSFKVSTEDVNQKLSALRQIHSNLKGEIIDLKISSCDHNLMVTCREKFSLFKEEFNFCSDICRQKGIQIQKVQKHENRCKYSLLFSINNSILEHFMVRFEDKLGWEYANGLLKVKIGEGQPQQQYISVINEITNNNGILVWCDIPEILLRIKPSLDSSEVGAELMRKIVEVREGLDPRNVLYSHGRYQEYFAKGLFRKLTEYFW